MGLVRLADETVGLDPDQEVQARIRLAFQKFADLGSARADMHYLRQSGLPLPSAQNTAQDELADEQRGK